MMDQAFEIGLHRQVCKRLLKLVQAHASAQFELHKAVAPNKLKPDNEILVSTLADIKKQLNKLKDGAADPLTDETACAAFRAKKEEEEAAHPDQKRARTGRGGGSSTTRTTSLSSSSSSSSSSAQPWTPTQA